MTVQTGAAEKVYREHGSSVPSWIRFTLLDSRSPDPCARKNVRALNGQNPPSSAPNDVRIGEFGEFLLASRESNEMEGENNSRAHRFRR